MQTNTYLKKDYNTINTNDIKVDKSKQYNIVSLFSGVGGMDLGFEGGFDYLDDFYDNNPFKVIFANDIFKQAAEVYEANFGIKVEQTDISQLDLKEDFPDDNVDIILGGFPCQTFSYSGKRGGLSDARGILYKQMIRVVRHYKPKMFVAENVDGIRNSMKNFNGENVNWSAIDQILQEFDEAGYNVQYHVLNAADYGVPQNRRRVIILGIRKDLGTNEDVYYPAQLFDEKGNTTGKKWRTSFDGIDDLWEKVNDPTIANHSVKDISKAKFYPGKKMQGNNKIKEDRPAPTIRAEHHGNIEAHYRSYSVNLDDMTAWRRLSVRECARLQAFPDNFNFTCSASSAYKGIGNAVPPVMGWHIARAICYTLDNINQ